MGAYGCPPSDRRRIVRYVEAAGVRLSSVGLGTWQFGSSEWGYGTAYADGVAPKLVHAALDLGINLIDTAEAYAFGRSEKIVGEAIEGRRDEAFLATKLFPLLPIDPVVGRRARGSARRLGVDKLDLYQVHWHNRFVSIDATMDAMRRLIDDGLIANVGVSNFSLAQWQEAEAALGAPVLSNQVRFSLLDRGPDDDLVPWAQANGRVVIAYSPLSQGVLSGRYGPDHVPSAMRASSPAFLPENLSRVAPVLSVLAELATLHDATSSQVALAWLLRRPNVVVIPGASSLEQLARNSEAADLELSEDEDRALADAAARYEPVAGAQALAQILRLRSERALSRLARAVDGLGR